MVRLINKIWKKTAAGLFGVVIFAAAVSASVNTAAGNSKEERAVRIGYIESGTFLQETDNGYEGYLKEYLGQISKITGWRYEYVCGTWSECKSMLREGSVDLVCMAEYTEERHKYYVYSSKSLGYDATVLYADDDADIYYEDYDAMEGCTVGVLKDTVYEERLENIIEEKGINLQKEYFETSSKMHKALKDGTVDLIMVGSMFGFSDCKIVGKYDVKPYYAIGYKENSQIIEAFNDAVLKIDAETPEKLSDLYEKYYSDELISSSPLFTREEIEFIKNADPVEVKLLLNKEPLGYYDGGEPAGIFVEHLNMLSQYSGIEFVITDVKSDSINAKTENMADESYITLRAKRVADILGEESGLITTEPLVKTELAYIGHRNILENLGRDDYVLAVTREMTYIEELVEKSGEEYTIKYYGDTSECFDAVIRGEADIAVQDAYVSTYLLQKPIYEENLVKLPGEDMTNGMCIIASKDQQMLVDIFNKTIDYISVNNMKNVLEVELLKHTYAMTFSDFMYTYWHVIVIICAILIAVAILYMHMTKRMARLQVKKKEYEILRKKTQRDELTGIYNKEYFYVKAKELIDRSNEDMCIVILDITNFKIINDLFGMEKGDMLLKHVADMLLKRVKGKDIVVSRFNADHFYMCMPKKYVDEIEFPRKISREFTKNMEISLNYGVFDIGDNKDIPINIMCDRAALAVHTKDVSRRAYIHFYTEEQRKRIVRKQEIENEMDNALENREFCVFIQPKYDIDNETIIGGEALVRWCHPEKGMISPGEFIPVFESNGFILKLDYFVWEETCRLINELKKQGAASYPVSINVSRAHFYGNDLKNKLQELTSKYDLEPEELELEITETIYSENISVICERIKELQEAGFKIAMDDFGSGYSSLNMLKEIPLDIIKMDLKFLDSKDNVEKSHKILKTLLELAKSLELFVVVEGVETREQVEFLKEIGNFYAQGYYFSRPVDSQTYEKMILIKQGI